MSLNDWRANGWLQEHAPASTEIADKYAVVDRALADAAIADLSPDAKAAQVHTAALALAAVALAAEGYRMAGRDGSHERLIESLRYTISVDSALLRRLQSLRRVRNTMSYERVGVISDVTVQAYRADVTVLKAQVTVWLGRRHPALL